MIFVQSLRICSSGATCFTIVLLAGVCNSCTHRHAVPTLPHVSLSKVPNHLNLSLFTHFSRPCSPSKASNQPNRKRQRRTGPQHEEEEARPPPPTAHEQTPINPSSPLTCQPIYSIFYPTQSCPILPSSLLGRTQVRARGERPRLRPCGGAARPIPCHHPGERERDPSLGSCSWVGTGNRIFLSLGWVAEKG